MIRRCSDFVRGIPSSALIDVTFSVVAATIPIINAVLLSLYFQRSNRLFEASDLWIEEMNFTALLIQLACVLVLCLRVRGYLIPVVVVVAWATAVLGRVMIDFLYIEPLRISNDYGSRGGFYLALAAPFVVAVMVAMAVRLFVWMTRGRRADRQSK